MRFFVDEPRGAFVGGDVEGEELDDARHGGPDGSEPFGRGAAAHAYHGPVTGMLIAQITDCHVVARGRLLAGRVDTAAMLRRALAHIVGLDPRPELVLATGDLVNDGTPEEYDRLVELLAGLDGIPIVVIPGNHDDRDELRRRFPGLPTADEHDGRLDRVVETHPVRIVALDTTEPGEHGGRIRPDQMGWLEAVLAAEPDRPTLVAQHHPPFETGIAWMDEVGLVGADLEADVLARHRNVVGVVAGHVHRLVMSPFGGTVASCWPSTGAQVALRLDGTRYLYADEPAAVALHRWSPGHGLTSLLSQVDEARTWLPDWARAELDDTVREL